MRQHLPRAVSLSLALGLALTACALGARVHQADRRGRPGQALREPARHGHPTGITFDATGHFGHKLLVTASHHAETTVLAIDCAGGVRVITSHAPAMEGGIAGAPASFGRYGGDLVAPGETSGRVFVIRPDGSVVTLVVSALPHGGGIGVESAGLVPPGSGTGGAAYLAGRFSKGNRHPGTDSILRLPGRELIKAGVRPGDLLVGTGAGARTIVVRCASSCTARYIAAALPSPTPKNTSRSLAPAVSPGRPAAPGTGAGGRLTDARPEVAAGLHRPAGTPRPELMTEAK